jgi:hypothetical protein
VQWLHPDGKVTGYCGTLVDRELFKLHYPAKDDEIEESRMSGTGSKHEKC